MHLLIPSRHKRSWSQINSSVLLFGDDNCNVVTHSKGESEQTVQKLFIDYS